MLVVDLSYATRNGSDATFEKLLQKHPSASHPSMPCPPDSSPLQASAKHLEEVVKKSPRGSGPGADGWRFEHFRILQQDDRSASLLLQVCNLFLNGSIPSAAATAFAGARLIALRKGKSDVRPIAVGNVFRRLVYRIRRVVAFGLYVHTRTQFSYLTAFLPPFFASKHRVSAQERLGGKWA